MSSIPAMGPSSALMSTLEAVPRSGASSTDFGEVYAEHFEFVWRSLRRLGVPSAQMDDATQDVFLVVHRRLRDFEHRSSMKTWLFGIIMRIASRYRRSAARRPTQPLPEEAVATGAGPDELAEAARAARLVRQLLDELDDNHRAVFVLVELEQLTAPEIAAALGVNLNTVYSRLRTARRDFDAALSRYLSRGHNGRPQLTSPIVARHGARGR